MSIRSTGLLGTTKFSNFLTRNMRANQLQINQLVSKSLFNQQRLYSRQTDMPRFLLPENGLIGDFVPMSRDKRPSIFSKLGLKIALQHWKNTAVTTFAIGNLRMKIKKWSPREFINDSMHMYEEMNSAFARGDRSTLENLCHLNMLSKLKNDMKKRVGVYKWKKIRDIVPSRIVQARTGSLSPKSTLCQVVIRIEQEQSIAIYNNSGKLIGGDPEKAVPITEHVVFQRVVGDDATPWMIYGKLEETKYFIPYKKN
ncbi:hypothetical protein BB559_003120 [Furculomyces boomerangus]|uniref:Large ribosomal subunit protein mL45 n=2 Tax=Harpellales TaxID=61421 RepID=A0A2T9YNN6_9FUNG|nr:hypothetical protein BB559_003120 [Furculomyces boomerangus]PWA00105.1 hypothetical protein BB558_003853 [Smittium angustum]